MPCPPTPAPEPVALPALAVGLGIWLLLVVYIELNDWYRMLRYPYDYGNLVQRLTYHLPKRFAWTLHNVVGHPLYEVFKLLGADRLADKVHDGTLPPGLEE